MANEPRAASTRRCVQAGRLDQEMGRSAPLLDGEAVSAEGIVRYRTPPFFERVAYLRVSVARICLVAHFAFRPDVLVEVPRAALLSVSRGEGAWVRIDARAGEGTLTVQIKPWERQLRRLVAEPVLTTTPDGLRDLLR